jgi:hypothetical protein
MMVSVLLSIGRVSRRFEQKPSKSAKLTGNLPLITVWLQVRVLAGPPVKSAGHIDFFVRHDPALHQPSGELLRLPL